MSKSRFSIFDMLW